MWKYLNFTIEMKMNEPIVRIRELKSPFLVKIISLLHVFYLWVKILFFKFQQGEITSSFCFKNKFKNSNKKEYCISWKPVRITYRFMLLIIFCRFMLLIIFCTFLFLIIFCRFMLLIIFFTCNKNRLI